MDLHTRIDSFVVAINSAPRIPLLQKDLPITLRDGEPDENGYVRWKICKTDCTKWTDIVESKLPIKFPKSYKSLISRYAFPSFQCGSIFLHGNTGHNIEWELSKQIFRDEFMSRHLFQNGYLQFGNPFEFNCDPICFDTNKRTESPIVQIDHEEILCNSKTKVVKEIAPAFLDFIRDIIAYENRPR